MNRKSLSIYVRFFLQFLLLILVFIITFRLVYKRVEASLEQNTIESNQAILEQAALVSDHYLDSMHATISQLMLDSSINQMMYLSMDVGSRANYYMLEARDSLRASNMTNEFASLIFIYFANSDVVLTPSTAYVDPFMFYSIHLKDNAYSFEEWYANIKAFHMQDYYPDQVSYVDGNRENVIIYEQSLPLASAPNHDRGTMGIMIREKAIRRMMNSLNVEGGWYYILDERSGRLIASSGALSEEQLNLDQDSVFEGNRMVLARTTSQYGWAFVAVLPYDVVMADVRVTYRFIMLGCFLCALLCIVFSIIAAYWNSTPVIRLISNLNRPGSNRQDNSYSGHFAYIESAFTEINDQNQYLTQQHSANLPLLRAYFFERLLSGHFEQKESLLGLMRQLNIPINATGYSCVFIALDNESDEPHGENLLPLIQRIGDSFRAELLIFPYLKSPGICMLLITSGKALNGEQLSDLIRDFCDMMNQQSRQSLFFACGRCVTDPSLLHQTIAEAHQVLMSTAYRNTFSGIVWYDESPVSNDMYLYTQENASRLTSLLRSGNYENCRSYLSELLKDNLESRVLSPGMIRHLLHEISGTIIDAALPMGEPGQRIATRLVEGLPSGDTPAIGQYVDLMYGCVEEICNNLSLVHNERRKKLAERLVSYIKDNFQDSNLSLFSIADEFGLSKSYLSSFFRESTGTNISRFIENTRIEAACVMLQEGKLNIDQIAAACGYNSALSFRRAFKRLKEVNPSEMRGIGQKGQ